MFTIFKWSKCAKSDSNLLLSLNGLLFVLLSRHRAMIMSQDIIVLGTVQRTKKAASIPKSLIPKYKRRHQYMEKTKYWSADKAAVPVHPETNHCHVFVGIPTKTSFKEGFGEEQWSGFMSTHGVIQENVCRCLKIAGVGNRGRSRSLSTESKMIERQGKDW